MTELNEKIAAKGTQEAMDAAIKDFKDGKLTAKDIYKGDYKGTNPFDKNDTIDLTEGFAENSTQSAPTFAYVLDDIITVLRAEPVYPAPPELVYPRIAETYCRIHWRQVSAIKDTKK